MDTCVHWLGIWRLNSVWALDTPDTEYRKYTSYGNDLVWVSSGKYHFIRPTKAKISLVWLQRRGDEWYERCTAYDSLAVLRTVANAGKVTSAICWMIIPLAGVQIKLDWKGVTG